MKKFILPLVLFFIILLSPSNSFAQESTDCWSKHMIRQYSVCTKAHTECLQPCSVLKTTPERKACFEDCGKAKNICTDKAVADYRACIAAGKQPEKSTVTQQPLEVQPTPSSDPTSKPQQSWSNEQIIKTMEEEHRQTDRLMKLWGFEPSEAWLSFRRLTEDTEFSEQPENVIAYVDELLNRTPELTNEIIQKAQADWEAMFAKTGQESMAVINGQGQLKSAGPGPFVLLAPESGRMISDILFNKTLINSNKEMLQIEDVWSADSGAVINMPQWTEIKFLEPTETQEPERMIELNKGELEIKVENAKPKEKFGVQTEFLDLIVIGTHFWVKNDPDKGQTLVVVYEGKVEVKTKDGKTTMVSPDGDKPGVLVVSQKLSPVKVATVGVVLATAVGGAILILRKKFTPKGFSKKKKWKN